MESLKNPFQTTELLGWILLLYVVFWFLNVSHRG